MMPDDKSNVTPIRDAIEGAPRAPAAKKKSGSGGKGPKKYHPDRPDEDLPEGCPIVPLGVQGKLFYYLDELKQMRELKPKDHGRLDLMSLFGRRQFLARNLFPRYDKDGLPTGAFAAENCAEALMGAAARRGVWNPFDQVRGAGAWRGEQDELILHCGDMIWIGTAEGDEGFPGRWIHPGLHGRHVYTAAPPGPQPAAEPAIAGPHGPAATVLEALQRWNWRRGDVDAQLMLGWIACAMIGGALDWRPLAWVTGGKGTGKSHLQKMVARLLGGSLVSVSDATAAGVWQKIGYATLPVALDEIEAEEDGRQSQKVIKLARQAASGGMVLRGGADHSGAEFRAQSCFLFSSILVPPLLSQDRSRMAILELGKHTSLQPPDLDITKLGSLGAMLRRRLADGWPQLQSTIDKYRIALGEAGHESRGADLFGTLLACADLVLNDEPPDSDSVTAWAEKLKAVDLAELEGDQEDERHMLAHLLTTPIDAFRSGSKSPLAKFVEQAAADSSDNDQIDQANRILGIYGLKVVHEGAVKWLFMANSHSGLSGLFAGSHWAGRSGSVGVWSQAARRLPGAEVRKTPVWISGGPAARGVHVPIACALAGRPGGDQGQKAERHTPVDTLELT